MVEHSHGPMVSMETFLTDRNLNSVLSILMAREDEIKNLGPWDLRAAIVEVLKWEGIHA